MKDLIETLQLEERKASKTDDDLIPSKKHRKVLQMSKRTKKPIIDLTKKKLGLMNEDEKTRDVSD